MKSLSIETIEKNCFKSEHQIKERRPATQIHKRSLPRVTRIFNTLRSRFENETIGEFIDLFHRDDMSEETWRRLSNRLRQTVTNRQEEEEGRYPVKQFLPNGDQKF